MEKSGRHANQGGPRSSSSPLHPETAPLQFRGQEIAMVSLDLDRAVFYRASGSATSLQFPGQLPHTLFVQRHAENNGYGLASPSLGFPADPHNSIACNAT